MVHKKIWDYLNNQKSPSLDFLFGTCFIIKKVFSQKGAYLTDVCKWEESFVDFANKFLMSSCISCRVVNAVDARPVFENLSKFCDLIARASRFQRKGAEISFIKF